MAIILKDLSEMDLVAFLWSNVSRGGGDWVGGAATQPMVWWKTCANQSAYPATVWTVPARMGKPQERAGPWPKKLAKSDPLDLSQPAILHL